MHDVPAEPIRRVKWSYDEIVLICAAVADNGWKALNSVADPRVIALSDLLRSARPEQADDDPAFRNANGIKRKSHDIATARSDYAGVRTKGGQTTRDVVSEFESTPHYMHERARAIRAAIVGETP